MSYLEDHPEEQKVIEFSAEVNAFLTGNRLETEPAIVPLFEDLSTEDEASFRKHARENYVVGEQINELYHPVWKDEARKMNEEADPTFAGTIRVVGDLFSKNAHIVFEDDPDTTCRCGHPRREHIPQRDEMGTYPGECNECSCGQFLAQSAETKGD